MPSERSFGILFALVCTGLAGYGLYRDWPAAALILLLTVGLLLVLSALIIPRLLVPFNRAWFHFGQFLHRLVSPLVLGVLFFGLLTPMALIIRASGRDELRLKRRPTASFWIERDPPGPAGTSFHHQF